MNDTSPKSWDTNGNESRPKCVPCVSFQASDPPEKSLRFTISSQPSKNLTNKPQHKVPLESKRNTYDSTMHGKDVMMNENLKNSSLTAMLKSDERAQTSEDDAMKYVNFSGAKSASLKSPPTLHMPDDVVTEKFVTKTFDEKCVPNLTQRVTINQTSGNQSLNTGKKSTKMVIRSPQGPPVPFKEFLMREDDNKIHILLGCTGSVATIKVPLIIDKLFQMFGKHKISIQLVVTRSAAHFLKGLKIHKDVKIWRDEDEWSNLKEDYFQSQLLPSSNTLAPSRKIKNNFEKLVLHVELQRWADIFLIAPLSANTLAKITNGISDNLLTSIIRTWVAPPCSNKFNEKSVNKPVLVAPAMNVFMYTHPLTSRQLRSLSSDESGLGFEILKPVEKVLICGDIGMGGMREWLDIVVILAKRIASLEGGLNENNPDETNNTSSDKIDDDEDDDDVDDNDDDDDEADDDDDEADDDDDEADDDDDEVADVDEAGEALSN